MKASLNGHSNRASIGAPETQPWVEKFRPKTLDDVAAHQEIIETIKRLVGENKLPHLLLYGPPGTGKTSTILAVARQLYGKSFGSMVLELNASDDRGISVVRQQVQDFASSRTLFGKQYKMVILDECDAMTKDAQFALRRIIEKYTRSTRFCLICNYVSKIIPALQSRCTRFRFPPLGEASVRERLRFVAEHEKLQLGEAGMQALITLGAGDMRRTLNIFQATSMASDEITEAAVYSCTGNPLPQDIQQIVEWIMNQSFTEAFASLCKMQVLKGLALVDIIQQLHTWVFRLEMSEDARIPLIDRLATVEVALSTGTSEKLQLGAVIAAFSDARRQMML